MTSSHNPPPRAGADDRYRPPHQGELDDLAVLLADGRLSGGAPILPTYENALAAWFGVARAVAVNSGSSALHATLHALGVKPGDAVLVPATAPLPTAMPILTCGATPVIVDTQPGSLALDPADLHRKLTNQVRAAILLPLWGYPNDDHHTHALLAEAGVPVIEDACQAHGTRIHHRYAGTLAAAGCFSAHDRKLLSTGEGGFVLTDDPDLADRIDHYTHFGHLRGHRHGVNFKLAAPLAAIGLRRLTHLHDQLQARRRTAQRVLAALPPDGILRELPHPAGQPNYYTLVLTATARHQYVTQALTTLGLPPDSVRYRDRPLHHQPLFSTYATTDCPNAEALASTTVQVPAHPGLSHAAVAWIADQLATIAEQGHTA